MMLKNILVLLLLYLLLLPLPNVLIETKIGHAGNFKTVDIFNVKKTQPRKICFVESARRIIRAFKIKYNISRLGSVGFVDLGPGYGCLTELTEVPRLILGLKPLQNSQSFGYCGVGV